MDSRVGDRDMEVGRKEYTRNRINKINKIIRMDEQMKE